MAIEKEKLDALRAQHGEVVEVTIGGQDLAFRPASETEYFRCVGQSAKDQAQAPKALHRLAHDCVVYPELQAFSALVTKRPGIAVSLGGKILKFASGEDEELAGKA